MWIWITLVAVGIGVAAAVVGVMQSFKKDEKSEIEDRLDELLNRGKRGKKSDKQQDSLLTASMQDQSGVLDEFLERFGNLKNLSEQADAGISLTNLALVGLGIGGVLFIIAIVAPIPKVIAPLLFLTFAPSPFIWLLMKRKKRLARINAQLPEAMELLGRTLRAGHSLGAGIGLIGSEMQPPIALEFHKCYEEQTLGKSLEESLMDMANRVPNLDIRFFVTAVLLQRQTGGDLAEILDKIGRLVRARFKLAGQIAALTGEGRLSGIVLLGLPPSLFCVMFYLNREYTMTLFTDPVGQRMLAGAIVMQLLGALVIRKIITIRV